jgi:ribonuclease G
MEVPANLKKVLHELKTWLGRDRAKTKAFEVSELGLIEMTRQRRRPSLYHSMTEACEECASAGRVLQLGTLARKIERQVRRLGIAGKEKQIQVRAHPAVALHLLEEEREVFDRLQNEYGLKVEIRDDPLLHRDDYAMYALPAMKPLKVDGGG